ncbi:putative defensin-like protein 158 isoform X2 [Eutrema salsugineum]|uniref:putative defensin-like protein 158 isoform X2 n=1 Tax=Eutrema salsugineum TaxID=72664 RepID=UPI000CED7484|nr:putative defensin-like protein 158 isoform X2 [Eutrema salsugineum]
MAKFSCSYFLIIMLVFSVVQRAKGQQCTIIIDQKNPCDLVDCRLNCYEGYNGVGKCIKDTKVGGDPSCVCTYNC